jgi:hypothetical protein
VVAGFSVLGLSESVSIILVFVAGLVSAALLSSLLWIWRANRGVGPDDWDMEAKGVKLVVDMVRKEALDNQKNAARLAHRNQRAHFAIGIGAIVAGAVAGTAGLAEKAPLLVGLAGFTAAALGGLAAWFNGEARTNYQWRQGAAYGNVVHKAAICLQRESGPTEDEAEQLTAELSRLRANTFPPSAG